MSYSVSLMPRSTCRQADDLAASAASGIKVVTVIAAAPATDVCTKPRRESSLGPDSGAAVILTAVARRPNPPGRADAGAGWGIAW